MGRRADQGIQTEEERGFDGLRWQIVGVDGQ